MKSQSEKESCLVGKCMQDQCHTQVFSKDEGFIKIRDLDDESRDTLIWRTNIFQYTPDDEICLHHQQKFLKKYSLSHKKCCNPFEKSNHKG